MNILNSDVSGNNAENLSNSQNYISSENIGDLLRGASILSGGGGGSYQNALDNYESLNLERVEVRELADFDPDDNIATIFGLGPVDNTTEDPLGIAQESAEYYESQYGNIDGIILGEIGPDLIVEAVAIADRLDVPVANADVAGMRAVPSIQNEIIEDRNISRTPVVATNGQTQRVYEADKTSIDEELRQLSNGEIWYLTGYAESPRVYQQNVPENWFEECLNPGIQGDITQLGSGIVESFTSSEIEGHNIGRVIIEGRNRIEVFFQNENILAYIDGELAAEIPDTITLVDEQGIGVSNGNPPDTGDRIEVYQISYPFWRDADVLTRETQEIRIEENSVIFQENTEFDIRGGSENV